MATLTNTKIKDTYDGLLKTTDNEALDVSGVTLIEDGLGNASALSVGRSGNGVTVTGSLNATLATAAQPNITSVGTLSSLSVSGNLAVDTNTLYVDASGNRVGIGTSIPASNTKVTMIHPVGGVGIQISDNTYDTGFLEVINQAFQIRANNNITFDIGGEKMRIDSSGNVGINNSDPLTGLSSNYRGLHISGTNPIIRGSNGATDYFTLYGNASTTFLWADGARDLAFHTNGTEKMRITSDGYVGVGTGNTNVLSGDLIGVLAFNSKDSSTNSSGAIGSIRSYATASFNTGQVSGDLRFYTQDSGSPNGSLLSGSERMRITSGGNVLINLTSSIRTNALFQAQSITGAAATQPTVLLKHQSSTGVTYGRTIEFFNSSNAEVGSIESNGTTTRYNISSDYRLKENVVPMTGALERVDALKPSRFNFISVPELEIDGFLAHEVAEVVPEAISGEKDAVDEEGNPIYQGIDQSKIVPLLVGAIKELRAEIELLKSQLNG